MKRWAVLLSWLLALVLPFLAVAAGEGQEKQPKIVIDEMIYDFGAVYEQAKLSHAFIVRNEGKADLVIESVKPG